VGLIAKTTGEHAADGQAVLVPVQRQAHTGLAGTIGQRAVKGMKR